MTKGRKRRGMDEKGEGKQEGKTERKTASSIS